MPKLIFRCRLCRFPHRASADVIPEREYDFEPSGTIVRLTYCCHDEVSCLRRQKTVGFRVRRLLESTAAMFGLYFRFER
jgi:hypothetical protein